MNDDTTGTFGFEIYKKGEAIRKWMSGEGEVLKSEGKMISGEKKRFEDNLKETSVEDVVDFIDTVIKITHDDLEKCKSTFYSLK